MQPKTCAFTGHRPAQMPDGGDELSPFFQALKAALEAVLRQTIAEGFTVFRSGGAMGFDLWAAEMVLFLKAEHPCLQLQFILPCETQANDWPEAWRERYFNALAQADEVTYVQARYSADCLFRRNRALVDGAQLVIACYSGSATGGTAYTVRYAAEQGVPIHNIYPT